MEGGRKMISLQERKLALIIQNQQLNRELENLKQQEYRESQLQTYKGRVVCMALIDLIESTNNSKG